MLVKGILRKESMLWADEETVAHGPRPKLLEEKSSGTSCESFTQKLVYVDLNSCSYAIMAMPISNAITSDYYNNNYVLLIT